MLGRARGRRYTATAADRRTWEGPRFERSAVVQGLSGARLRERCSSRKTRFEVVLRCGDLVVAKTPGGTRTQLPGTRWHRRRWRAPGRR